MAYDHLIISKDENGKVIVKAFTVGKNIVQSLTAMEDMYNDLDPAMLGSLIKSEIANNLQPSTAELKVMNDNCWRVVV